MKNPLTRGVGIKPIKITKPLIGTNSLFYMVLLKPHKGKRESHLCKHFLLYYGILSKASGHVNPLSIWLFPLRSCDTFTTKYRLDTKVPKPRQLSQ